MSKGTILIIDDNRLNRELSAELLEDEGYQVISAINAHAGMNEATAHRPDLILLDLHLPDYDGFSLARQLKATEGLQQVPIAAFTAMPDAQSRALENGCCRVITKPIDLDNFVSIVDDCIALAEMTTEEPTRPAPQKEIHPSKKNSAPENADYLQHLETLVQHDLKSPLCSSKIALEILLSGKLGELNDRQRELASEALNNHSLVLELLNNLHGLFLYERQLFQLTLAPTEIEPVILEVLEETVRPLIEKKDLKLNLGFEKPYQAQQVDRQELKKALRMLCLYYAQILSPGSDFSVTTQYMDETMRLKLGSNQGEAARLLPIQPNAGDRLAQDYCRWVFQSFQAELKIERESATILFQRPASLKP